MVERYRDGSAFEANASYSRAVRAGGTIIVSGTAALGTDGVALHLGDVYGQTREALERAIEAVERLGGAARDVTRTRILLLAGCDWRAAVRAHQEVFDGVDPANTTYFAAGFVPDGVLVEVEVDAYVNPVPS